ncbi:sensor histidine kinase [Lacinutrix algicola]|uniref:sensor histidine kinase n=1 Tax=Lacinutrix algicola TaxID=342954 RepID=UPI0006E203DA|nr:PAS domain-containing sensor histidine kinase [Lacinutrix algicola]
MEIFKKTNNVFKTLSEAISEGIIVVNSKQIIVATNKSSNALFGYEEEELIGKPLEILIPQKYHHNHSKQVDTFLEHSGKRQMGHGRNLYGLRKDGSTFPVEAGLNPFKVYDNDYVMALIIDITVRKKAEEELTHWANIFNESLNEIFIFDTETFKFLNVNAGAIKNIGYSLEELRELTPLDIKPHLNKDQFKETIQPLLDGTEIKIKFNTIHQRKDGTQYPVEIHLQRSRSNDRDTLIAIILDITERLNYTERLEKTVEERTQQLQEALHVEKELNELKTKFLSLVSHEFKTPLSGILTSSTLIGKYTKSEQQEKRDKHINTIQNKVKYLNNIINDFLSIERLESGKVNYKFSTFSLSKVVNEVIYDANMLLKEGQTIIYPDAIDDIVLDFDEKILELMLTNLVNNAIKYSPENTKIEVKVWVEEEGLKISIIDAGIGIPEEEQKFLFNRYFRAENALLTQGTGIGLNIVKSHLENLGGCITFISEENKGTTFTVTIPVNIIK